MPLNVVITVELFSDTADNRVLSVEHGKATRIGGLSVFNKARMSFFLWGVFPLTGESAAGRLHEYKFAW